MSGLLRLVYRVPARWRRLLRRVPGADRLRAVVAGSPAKEGPPAGSKRPVVYLPTWVRWDVMRQRPQYLLQAFAAHGHPVYFVDPNEPAARDADGVHIVPDLASVPSRHVILYVHFAPMRHLFGSFEEPAVVYDLLDDLSIYDADEVGLPEERRVRWHHPHVMEEAAVVIVSNPVLAETHRHERADLVLVHNGVDAGRFARPAAQPADLTLDDRPIVGYHGMISYWFDFDLLIGVARARPDLRFVLVGPTDERAADQVARLREVENIELLGERPSGDMPAFVQSFDVGTVWFEVNDLTRAVTPLKMYEYLAAGVPCVATPLPACIEEEQVLTASTVEEFSIALDRALAVSDREPLRAAARRSDWVELVRPVIDRLAELGLDRV
jgi:glycosyltransferase involved in cell wall biosynthesis